MAQKVETKDERPLQTFWLKNFKAVNTVASRIAEPDDSCFYDLTNAQPIGQANLHSIHDATLIHDFGSERVYKDWAFNMKGGELILSATTDGNLFAYGVGQTRSDGTADVWQINGSYKLSGTDALDIAQYDDNTAVIIDSTGYYGYQEGYVKIHTRPGGWVPTSIFPINTATSGSPVGKLVLTSGGSGYSNPTATISGGGGSGATAQVAQTGGIITGIDLWNPGSGYTSAPTVTITGGGGTGATATAMLTGTPNKGQAIAVYNNMVWVADGRTLYWSVPGTSSSSPSGPLPGYEDFTASNGGGWLKITDSYLRSDITALFSANGYLYVFGETSIDVISGVQTQQVGTTSTTVTAPAAITTFARQNITASIGTDQAESIISYGSYVFFANRMGAWQIIGSTVMSLSSDVTNNYLSGIDGTWQYLDFNHQNDAVMWINRANEVVDWENNAHQTVLWKLDDYTPYTFKISAGVVNSNNLFCAAFLVVRKNDPIMGFGNFMEMYQGYPNDTTGQNYKWWAADWTRDIGPITHICSSYIDWAPALFGYITSPTNGHCLMHRFFADPKSAPSARMMTALWDFKDLLTDKQAIRAGIRVSLHGAVNPAVHVNLDTLNRSYPVDLADIGIVDWVNSTEQIVPWENNVPERVKWQNLKNYLIYWGKPQAAFSKCLGFTVTTEHGTMFEMNSFLLDYKVGARWVGD